MEGRGSRSVGCVNSRFRQVIGQQFDIALEEIAKVSRGEKNIDLSNKYKPVEPTIFNASAPGSLERIELYRARAARGEQIFSQRDSTGAAVMPRSSLGRM